MPPRNSRKLKDKSSIKKNLLRKQTLDIESAQEYAASFVSKLEWTTDPYILRSHITNRARENGCSYSIMGVELSEELLAIVSEIYSDLAQSIRPASVRHQFNHLGQYSLDNLRRRICDSISSIVNELEPQEIFVDSPAPIVESYPDLKITSVTINYGGNIECLDIPVIISPDPPEVIQLVESYPNLEIISVTINYGGNIECSDIPVIISPDPPEVIQLVESYPDLKITSVTINYNINVEFFAVTVIICPDLPEVIQSKEICRHWQIISSNIESFNVPKVARNNPKLSKTIDDLQSAPLPNSRAVENFPDQLRIKNSEWKRILSNLESKLLESVQFWEKRYVKDWSKQVTGHQILWKSRFSKCTNHRLKYDIDLPLFTEYFYYP